MPEDKAIWAVGISLVVSGTFAAGMLLGLWVSEPPPPLYEFPAWETVAADPVLRRIVLEDGDVCYESTHGLACVREMEICE